jgi:hypothetical protein
MASMNYFLNILLHISYNIIFTTGLDSKRLKDVILESVIKPDGNLYKRLFTCKWLNIFLKTMLVYIDNYTISLAFYKRDATLKPRAVINIIVGIAMLMTGVIKHIFEDNFH